MNRRVCVVAAGLLLGAVRSVGAAQADGALLLSPNEGLVGAEVRAEATVSRCPLFVVRWHGDIVGTDVGLDGRGSVTFLVPGGAHGTETVVATCGVVPGGPERIVGQAAFSVLEPGPTNTTSTTTSTTSVSATTVRPSPTVTSAPGRATSSVPTQPPPSTQRSTTSVRAATSTTMRSGTTPTTRPIAQDVAECERQARGADSRLVYQPNRRMTQGLPYDVVVQVALHGSDVSVVTSPGPEPTTVVRLRSARCTIEAQLVGAPSDFEVTPPGPLAQSFIATRVLTWRWQVTPLRAGPGLKLVLRLQPAVIEDGKAPRPGSDELHEALIEVDAQRQSLIAHVTKTANDVVGNNVVKLLLLPSGGGLLTVWAGHRYRRRTRDAHTA